MKEDHTNELSWLNENSSSSRTLENLNGSSGISRTATLLPKLENNISNSAAKSNVPSWALEDNSVDDDDSRSYESKDTRRSIQPINVKWKNKKGPPVPAEIHSGSTPNDDEEDRRCCSSDPVLVCFQFFHFTSGVSGLLALVSNAYVYTLHDLPIYDLFLHGYAIVFCLLIVFVELDWRYIVSKVKFLDLWVLRGLYYIFVGVITANNMRSQSIEHIAVTSQGVMGIVLCSYGGCYILMGIFCLKAVKENHMRMQYEQYMEIDDR